MTDQRDPLHRQSERETFKAACIGDYVAALEAERDSYRQALERIAATSPAAELGKPWKHWRTQAQEALNA